MEIFFAFRFVSGARHGMEARIKGLDKARSSLVVRFPIFHFLIFLTPALAKVTGECVNCHTMHNRQGGTPMPGVGNIPETGPFSALTRGTCVGCHSNTGSATIKTLGSSNIPVVFNTVPPATGTELAGGNFYWVVNSGEEYGHNVLTIPGIDCARYKVVRGSWYSHAGTKWHGL